MNKKISAESIRKCFSAFADYEMEVYDSLDSTNTVAVERMKNGCRQWYTVVSASQTGGQGRLGRSFFSPADTGLYMSIVLYPDENRRELLTGTAAVAVCEALEKEFSLVPKIKWVNDIFIDGRKVCGILAKGVVTDGGFGAVLGIGINVFCPEGGFPDDIKDTAGYLFNDRKELIRERLCAAVIERFKDRYEKIGRDDSPAEYRKRCLTVGKPVTVIPSGCPEKARPATALELDDRYRLSVMYKDGTTETLSSGEVSVRI
ncbi:MAG: biotin--[Clostridia bacterium]|nr:biotin--[acetyl-CoA-carboxylase] ligase [Clostridia bacterium]